MQLSTGRCVQDCLLKHLDVLVFVEALIYQVDEENEALAKAGQLAADHMAHGMLSEAAAASCTSLHA